MTSRRKGGSRSKGGPILLELSPAQFGQVIGAAEQAGGIRAIIFGLNGDPSALRIDSSSLDDPRLSRSLLAGLLVLAAFPADRSFVGNAEIAEMLGMTPTTTHRYISTLVAAGLLERDANTRKYRQGR
jgi:hypothetical protein